MWQPLQPCPCLHCPLGKVDYTAYIFGCMKCHDLTEHSPHQGTGERAVACDSKCTDLTQWERDRHIVEVTIDIDKRLCLQPQIRNKFRRHRIVAEIQTYITAQWLRSHTYPYMQKVLILQPTLPQVLALGNIGCKSGRSGMQPCCPLLLLLGKCL